MLIGKHVEANLLTVFFSFHITNINRAKQLQKKVESKMKSVPFFITIFKKHISVFWDKTFHVSSPTSWVNDPIISWKHAITQHTDYFPVCWKIEKHN